MWVHQPILCNGPEKLEGRVQETLHFAEQEDIAVAGYLSLLEAAAQAG